MGETATVVLLAAILVMLSLIYYRLGSMRDFQRAQLGNYIRVHPLDMSWRKRNEEAGRDE